MMHSEAITSKKAVRMHLEDVSGRISSPFIYHTSPYDSSSTYSPTRMMANGMNDALFEGGTSSIIGANLHT
ncbi:hypothetical protein ACMFMG_008535 [Clarireedia jacksonii]